MSIRHRSSPSLLLFSLLAATFSLHRALSQPIVLRGDAAHHVYDGHGALSAGASSRLLWDYPEPQRSQILDYLFKPQYGANLHLLKVEIGGSVQSTDGSERTPQPTRSDSPFNCTDSYEFFLIQEAKSRNPKIKTYALSWGVPAWIGNGSYFSEDNIEYQTNFVKCIRASLNFTIDYIGIWNERPWGSIDYVSSLKSSLVNAGLDTEIVIPDGSNPEDIVSTAQSNTTFKNAISVVGLHYPCNHPCYGVEEIGKKYWASEDYSTVANIEGAECWGRLLNQNYVRSNMTSTISWSLIWSVYPELPYFGNGLMYAMSPWSGFYSGGGDTDSQPNPGDIMNGPIWTTAHTTQFVQPGWRYLLVNQNGSGYLPGSNGGSYVTLVPPSSLSDITIVIEKLEGRCLRCAGQTTNDDTVTFQTTNGLPGAGTVLQVWRSNSTVQFWRDNDITIASDNTFSVFIPKDSIVTVSTVKGASKGQPSTPIPPYQTFPIPYTDNFDSYADNATAKYFSDQAGSFSVYNKMLHQIIPIDAGSNAWVSDPDPVSIIGGGTASVNYTIQVTVMFSGDTAGINRRSNSLINNEIIERTQRDQAMRKHFAELKFNDGDRNNGITSSLSDANIAAAVAPCDSSSKFQQWDFNKVASGYLSNGQGNDALCLNVDGCSSSTPLIYYQCLTNGGTCCGSSCYSVLQFSLNNGNSGQLISAYDNQCVTVHDGTVILTTACSGSSPNATWTYNTNTRQLQLQNTNLCLTTPPSISTYAQVCGRITGYSGFVKAPPTGYCFLITDDGSWYLRAGSAIVTKGTLGSNYDSMNPNTIALVMKGSTLMGYFNDPQRQHTPLFTVPSDNTYTTGLSAIGSGYHYAVFDDFSLTPE